MMIMQSQMLLRFTKAPGSLLPLFLFFTEACSFLPLLSMGLLKPYLYSGAVHFMASNNDCGVRDFNMEKFQTCKQFSFPWPVNVSTSVTERAAIIWSRIGGRVSWNIFGIG